VRKLLKLKPKQGEFVMKLEAIPPYFVRFFPNTEGIKKGKEVVIVRDPTRRSYQVDAIVMPSNCPISQKELETCANMTEVIDQSSAAAVSYAMRKGILLYLIRVQIHDVSSVRDRLVHPSCLCLKRKKCGRLSLPVVLFSPVVFSRP
jgi:hypothetical protein